MAINQKNRFGKGIQKWEVNFFPNPSTGEINISSNMSRFVKVTVKDVSGRNLMVKEINLNEFITKLELSLLNGVYLITFEASNHESISKKLLISK